MSYGGPAKPTTATTAVLRLLTTAGYRNAFIDRGNTRNSKLRRASERDDGDNDGDMIVKLPANATTVTDQHGATKATDRHDSIF